MENAFYILSLLLILANILPFIPHQHWIFRVFDFVCIQLLALQFPLLLIGFVFIENQNLLFWTVQSFLAILTVYNSYLLIPFTPMYRIRREKSIENNSELISVLSVNVYQFNHEFQRLIDLIHEIKPDIILTMESNKDWEEALSVLDKEYPNYQKVALENTYGMHFYSKLKTTRIQIHYFVADDLPSLEIDLETHNKTIFTLFCVHPAPPSPTEEKTSKERDGELLSIAKKVRKLNNPVIVTGDFNNVAWARSSVLFRKTSKLIDPRIGRGFVSTFHARYKLLRFPIDLFFHSTDIFIEEFKTLRPIGSDHLPLYCSFVINFKSSSQQQLVEELEKDEMAEVNEMIEKAREVESNRPEIAHDDK